MKIVVHCPGLGVALSLTNVAGGTQVEDDIGDLDERQVVEPGSKMFMRCAEDAACKPLPK